MDIGDTDEDRRPILLAGPTGAGKSALASALAARLGGWVVNADSQQVYAAWRVLSARPTAAEEAAAPHRLYGHLALGDAHSAGRWLRELAPVLAAARGAGARPVIVGGTGLYFRAATVGLTEIPAIPASVREALRARHAAEGLGPLADALAARDPATARGLDLANPARVLRALEVLEATGKGLARHQAETPPPLLPPERTVRLVIDAAPDWLNPRIDARFAAMLHEGAVEEVAAARAAGASPDLPGMKAIGVAEIARYLDGEATLAETAAAGALATRRYAKRQRTWLRNQMPGWTRLAPGDTEGAMAAIAARA
ncbi:MAG: tRNA (adenosine(37)-N6)-dimethylallyltransferase MiaA [Pseudomonadota bacterium]